MEKYRKYLLDALIGIFCGLLIAMGIHNCNRKPTKVIKVERDTIVQYDTISQFFPKPVGVERVRTEYKWLTRVQPVGKTDTFTMHDSVLVEVPIESKHYNAPEYDAWVSGYMPSLDSINVYQRTEYITETITRMKPPNRFSLGIQAGYGYGFRSKTLEPYVGAGLTIRIF